MFGSTIAPIVVILPSNTRSGNALDLDLYRLPDPKSRAVRLRHVRQHPHGVDVGHRIGRGRAARLHKQPRCRIARRDPAGDRARHDQGRVGHALGDDGIDLGVGLAENAYRVAPRPQVAFGGLLVGDRLLQIFLRHCPRRIELRGAPGCGWSAPTRPPRRSSSTRPASRSGLSMVYRVWPFFTSSPTLANKLMILP